MGRTDGIFCASKTNDKLNVLKKSLPVDLGSKYYKYLALKFTSVTNKLGYYYDFIFQDPVSGHIEEFLAQESAHTCAFAADATSKATY